MKTKTLAKPSKDFPLTPTKGGYWVKKIQGVQYRIGNRWATPEEVLKEWLRVKDELLAGEAVKPDPNALQLRDAMNHFLCDRLARLEAGEIVQRFAKSFMPGAQVVALKVAHATLRYWPKRTCLLNEFVEP